MAMNIFLPRDSNFEFELYIYFKIYLKVDTRTRIRVNLRPKRHDMDVKSVTSSHSFPGLPSIVRVF
ncbi:hypothetical protein KDAU_58940 [Dictyobacter aurantiacus]|uniref:Uncharacterized protein n=1 Tax=Dictyobacter aurantiacus TaxID=1936993 RepID=A0A401ZNX1_9CHLR|nr:hypothetical protein KDAU_58940 [Dictyobacter aurantiacus]